MKDRIQQGMIHRFRKHGTKNIDMNVTLLAVYRKHNGRCANCNVQTVLGKHPQVLSSATLEHKVPLSEGGDHTWENVELLCHRCNTSRNNDEVRAIVKKRFNLFGYQLVIKMMLR